jgi:hypothetical protein
VNVCPYGLYRIEWLRGEIVAAWTMGIAWRVRAVAS